MKHAKGTCNILLGMPETSPHTPTCMSTALCGGDRPTRSMPFGQLQWPSLRKRCVRAVPPHEEMCSNAASDEGHTSCPHFHTCMRNCQRPKESTEAGEPTVAPPVLNGHLELALEP